jgi:hypothetical protein
MQRYLSWKSSEDGAGLKVFIPKQRRLYIIRLLPFHNVRYIFEKSEMVAVSATTRFRVREILGDRQLFFTYYWLTSNHIGETLDLPSHSFYLFPVAERKMPRGRPGVLS